MQARQTARTPQINQQRSLLTIAIIAVVAVIVAVLAIIVSNNSIPTASPSKYVNIPQSRTVPDGGYVLGNPEARVTIMEFADFACPHCQEYSRDITKFINNYVLTGKAKFEYRLFISGADPTYGPYTAQLAECADNLKPGTFWLAHDVLFEIGSRARFNETIGRTLADRVGVSHNDLATCTRKANQYTKDMQLGTALGIQSTPSVMVRVHNGAPQFVVSGGRTWDRGPVPYELLVATVENYQ